MFSYLSSRFDVSLFLSHPLLIPFQLHVQNWKHVCEDLNFEVWSSHVSFTEFIDWMMRVSHVELECHLWNMFALGSCPNYETYLILTKNNTHGQQNLPSRSQVLVSFYEDQIHLGASFSSFVSNFNWMGLCAHHFLKYNVQGSPCHVGDPDDDLRWRL